MADDKAQVGARDRAKVAANEPYEVAALAEKHDLSQAEARELIADVGNDRAALDKAARGRGTSRSATSEAAKPSPSPKPRGRGAAKPQTGSPRTRKTPKAAATGIDAVTAPLKEIAAPARRTVRNAAGAARRTIDTIGVAPRKAGRAVRDAAATARSAPAAAQKGVRQAIDSVKTAAATRTAAVLGAAAAGLAAGVAINLGRKAIVQAPSALAGDWFEAVKAEHKLALTIFDGLQATGQDDTGKRTALLIQLKHALGKHAFMEENVLYPALRERGDKADADKLNHDHGYVKQYLYDLDRIDNGSPAFAEKVAAFRADIEAHAAEEEQVIFPALHAALGARNAEITALANKEAFKLA